MLARISYSLVLLVFQPLVVLRLWYKSLKLRSYRGRIVERYGFKLPSLNRPVWIHAVSVGEVITAKPIVQYYLEQGHDVLVTTTTPTGAEQLQRMMGDTVCHRYLPQDIPFCVQRLIQTLRPKCLVIIETELWPNLIKQCQKAGVATVLANGRLSEKSARGYQRIKALSQPMLQAMSHICVQTTVEAERFQALGVAKQQLTVVPSLKFDAAVPAGADHEATLWRQSLGGRQRFIWVAASTHAGEEQLVIDIHQQLLETRPDAVLVIVPRHPDRFNDVATLCDKSGLRWQRLTGEPPNAHTQLWLADVMGKMWPLLKLSDVAMVGNSFNGGGGHNVMEPALCAKPILCGPAMFNFSYVTDALLRCDGLVQLEQSQIHDALCKYLDPEKREAAGQAALACAKAHAGGLAKTLAQIDRVMAN